MKFVLLVIDMQEIFFEETPEITRSMNSAVEDIHDLVSYGALVKMIDLI
jgi:isochorismate hydrolase